MRIFKTYDIRGTYPDQINEQMFERLGQAAAATLHCATCVVGRDVRTSSGPLQKALIRGLRRAGVHVIDIGMVSTPMMYYAVSHLHADAGAQITASHNPVLYNGCKWCRAGAVPVSLETGLAEMEQCMERGMLPAADCPGTLEEQDVGPAYRANLLKYADGIDPLTIVVDAGNGVMGSFLPPLFSRLPCEVIPLYFEPDGSFPNHEANPLDPANVRDLSARVVQTKADFGVAFDGDGDRCIFVDEKGAIVPADLVTALLAAELLASAPGETVMYDLRSSRIVHSEIERMGGRPLMCRVGHSFIKTLMREEQALFAGELTGHYYFRELNYTDNAEMTLLTVLSILSRRGGCFSAMIEPFRVYAATGEVNITSSAPAAAIARAEAELGPMANRILHLDGVSLYFDSWWCNIRMSNTEHLLRLNLEADTPEIRDAQRARVEALLRGGDNA